jgi:hypothetical protein
LSLRRRLPLLVLVLASLPLLDAGCAGSPVADSGLRLGPARGFEIPIGLPDAEQAAASALKDRGYAVAIDTAPADSPRAGTATVTGSLTTAFSAAPATVTASASNALTDIWSPSRHMDLRTRIELHLLALPRSGASSGALTLVRIDGATYLRQAPDAAEEESVLTKALKADLKADLERRAAHPSPVTAVLP